MEALAGRTLAGRTLAGGAVAGIEPVDFDELADSELLAMMAADAQRSTFYAARSVEAMERFRRRRKRDHRARQAAEEPHATLTPTAETVVEAGPLLGAEAGRLRQELGRTKMLVEDFPEVWALCRTGQLDVYRARVIAETAMARLEATADVRRLSELMAEWLLGSLPAERAGRLPLITKTVKQIRNRLNYLLARMTTRDADDRFKRSTPAAGSGWSRARTGWPPSR